MFDIFANWPQTQILYPLTLVIHTVEHYNVLTLQHFILNLGGGDKDSDLCPVQAGGAE